ncbi:MAG: HEAT repeat domain-containing protein, partial [Armatimonadota bacterium]
SALGEAKLVGGTEALSAAVREDTEPSPEVRTAAAYALGDLGAAAAEEAQQRLIAQALADGLEDKAGDVRIACAYSLGKVTLPTDMEAQMSAALKKAYDDKHYWARLAAQTSHTQLKLAD